MLQPHLIANRGASSQLCYSSSQLWDLIADKLKLYVVTSQLGYYIMVSNFIVIQNQRHILTQYPLCAHCNFRQSESQIWPRQKKWILTAAGQLNWQRSQVKSNIFISSSEKYAFMFPAKGELDLETIWPCRVLAQDPWYHKSLRIKQSYIHLEAIR